MATTAKKTTKKAIAAPKKTTSKATAAKKPVVKKTVAKKPVAKTVSVKKSGAHKSAKQNIRSFKLATDNEPFTSLRITRQTVYWIILVSFIIFAQLWIIKLQIDVATLIDSQQASLQEI